MSHALTEAVRMRGVSKHFGGVRALEGVDLDIRPGEVHALLGENGAGKSTILKILRGVQPPSAGTVEIGGTAMTGFTPEVARRLGVSMAFQEMSLVPTLTVAQNVFLNREIKAGALIDDRAAIEEARRLFARMGVAVDPLAKVADIPAGHRQLTEIVKATSQPCKVLVLDEPTTALSGNEVERLVRLRPPVEGGRRRRGLRLAPNERDLPHRGPRECPSRRAPRRYRTDGRLHPRQPHRPHHRSPLSRLLRCRARGGRQSARPFWRRVASSGSTNPQGSTDTARRGEVVGIAGLLGSGRSSLARVLAGVAPLRGGEIRVKGRAVAINKPADAIAAGIALVPEDRSRQGFVAFHSVESNIVLRTSRASPTAASLTGRSRHGWRTSRSHACASRRTAAGHRCAPCPAATRRRS